MKKILLALMLVFPNVSQAAFNAENITFVAQSGDFVDQTKNAPYGVGPDGLDHRFKTDNAGNLQTTSSGGGNVTVLDNTGNSIAGVTVNGLRRLGVNLASGSLSGTAATGYVDVVGGIDGSGITQPLQFDANKNVKVALLATATNSYFASVTGVAVSALTDFFTITGSGSKTIRVTKIRLSGIATAASAANVTALIRSTADTAGTSFVAANVKADSNNAAPTATVTAYTASPTLGALVGFVDSVYQTFTTSAGAIPNVPLEMAYGTRPAQSAVLRGTTQQLCLSLNGATITGLTVNVAVEWTEE